METIVPKHSYFATAPDGTVATRKTDRTYSHVVFARRSLANRLKFVDCSWPVDASNYAYYCDIHSGKSGHKNKSSYETDATHLRRLETAKTVAAYPNAAAYQNAMREERIKGVNAAATRGFFDHFVAVGWVGRRELASAHLAKREYEDFHVVAVERAPSK